jgi:hypothetical protein
MAFRVVAFKVRPLRPSDRLYHLHVQEKPPEGAAYYDLPLTLTPFSRIVLSRFTQWPPETCDRLVWEKHRLRFYYRDQWEPFFRASLPEGLWKATFLTERGAWSLARLRSMDYEGRDKPPVPGRTIGETPRDAQSGDDDDL